MIVIVKDKPRVFDRPMTVAEIAASISDGLRRAALFGRVNGKSVDLDYTVTEDCTVQIVTFRDPEGRRVFNRSCALVLAQAVKAVYPTAKLAAGMELEQGFYYDFDFLTPPTAADLPRIEAEMKKIVKANLPFCRQDVTRARATKIMQGFDESYKVETIAEMPRGSVFSLYECGGFIDFCQGPQIANSGMIKAFKLLRLTGAYWRGNDSNKLLTRIYGVAFDKKAELDAYIKQLAEAKLRDHNKVGRELRLFMTSDLVGRGLPLLLPKGAKVLQVLQRFVEDSAENNGYSLTHTPSLSRSDLYRPTGQWENWRERMFVLGSNLADDEMLALRPTTAPFHYQIFAGGTKSYRDMPVRYAETAQLFCKDALGETDGLLHSREMTTADCHIFCAKDQLSKEISTAFAYCCDLLRQLGLLPDMSYRLRTWNPMRKDRYDAHDKEEWERTTRILASVLDHADVCYTKAVGEADYCGPAVDIVVKNAYDRQDALCSLTIDFCAAGQYDLGFVDDKGVRQMPYVIHHTAIGSYERILALLIEKHNGALPVWLSPVQVVVACLTSRTAALATQVTSQLTFAGVRAMADVRDEKIGRKIREAALTQVPYIVVVGDRDADKGTISVRDERNKGAVQEMTIEDLVALVRKMHDEKR